MSESGQLSATSLTTDAIMHMGDNTSSMIKRDSEVWFEDGNIVVIAQNIAFRFHKSVVSIHSSVFRDLFSIPRPSPMDEGADETFDGCPVVRVSDTSYDFRELIRALYSGVSYLHPEHAVTFSVLAALARLSHKYQLDQLLTGVINRMRCTFTTKLEVWDRTGGFYSTTPLQLHPTDAIEALNLLRLLDRPEMIPMALFGCCQQRPVTLLEGVTRTGDGVTWERLSPSDLQLCLEVRERLFQTTACFLTLLCESYNTRLLQGFTNPGCSSPGSCLNGLRALLDSCHHNLRHCIFSDPFDLYYMATLDSLVYSDAICGVCADALQAEYEQFRKKAWASLPRIMGMEDEVVEWDSDSA